MRTIQIEIRNDIAIITGYVNAVERFSRSIPSPRGSFIEKVAPKTFQRALEKGNDIEIRLNHGKKIGSTKDGNLHLEEDNIGLKARAEISDAETVDKARKGELRGWSFGFIPIKDTWEEVEGIQKRSLEDINLTEVTLVDNTRMPAYASTSVEVRDGVEQLKETRWLEEKVTVEDFSKKEKENIDYSNYEKQIEILKLKIKG